MFRLFKFAIFVIIVAFLVVHFWPDVSQMLSPAVVHKATPYVQDGQKIIQKVSKS
jgi:hypothetical protein